MTAETELPGEISRWISAAKQGSNDAVGQMLNACSNYLLMVANRRLGDDWNGKIDPSSVVQETYLEACRDFHTQFSGDTEEELLAWLNCILAHNLVNEIARWKRRKRDPGREVPIGSVKGGLADSEPSPRAQVVAQEEKEMLDRALEQLSEDHRRVILLHHQQRLTFPEVGRQMNRSEDAARQLWCRALFKLEEILDHPHKSG